MDRQSQTSEEIKPVTEAELDKVQGGMHCAAGVHLHTATLEVRSPTDWATLARSYLGL
jgi:hypothetical protein